jgi:hypothetical protein
MMELAGKHLKLFQTLQQFGDAAVLGPLRHQQVLSKPLGSLTYSNIQQLANEARASLAEANLPVTPTSLREAAADIIERQRTLAEDLVGIVYDEKGNYYE